MAENESFDVMESFSEGDEITFQQILNALIRGDADLEMKTEIHNPLALSGFTLISEKLKELGLNNSNKLTEKWYKEFLLLMVSYQRKSRSEIVKAFQSTMESIKTSISVSEKMLSNLKK